MFPWSCRYLHFNALNYLSKTNVAGAPFSVAFPKQVEISVWLPELGYKVKHLLHFDLNQGSLATL